jgi:AGCS family alanine or glycine:cation symporter
VAGFFFAAIADTSLIWLIAAITVAFMTIPNLVAILLLRREMKDSVADYWRRLEEPR